MRGLKPPAVPNINIGNVASFTDAWIETVNDAGHTVTTVVASFTDAWIETFIQLPILMLGTSHLLQMRGLKLIRCVISRVASTSHLLQMRGLKLPYLLLMLLVRCRIFYRCVD